MVKTVEVVIFTEENLGTKVFEGVQGKVLKNKINF